MSRLHVYTVDGSGTGAKLIADGHQSPIGSAWDASIDELRNPGVANIRVVGEKMPPPLLREQLHLDFGGGDGVGRRCCAHRTIVQESIPTVKEDFPRKNFHTPGMDNRATEILAANLHRLMREHPELGTQAKVAAAARVDQKTISNCLNPGQRISSATGRKPSPTLAQVEKIAQAFDLEVWELLRL